MMQDIIVFSSSLVLSLGLTPLIRVLALRYRVCRPAQRRSMA